MPGSQTQLITNYLFNELNDQERKEFEKRLEADPVLSKNFQKYAEIHGYLKERISYEAMVRDPNLEEARRIADQVEDPGPLSPKGKGRSPKFLIPLLVAASLILGLIILRPFGASDPSRLYEKYYEPLNVAGDVYRSEEPSTEKSMLASGLLLYQARDYAGAEETLTEVVEASPRNALASLYLGLSKMENSKFDEAVALFRNNLYELDQYIPETQWYLSLCYLKTEKPAEAVKELELLVDRGGYFGNQAVEVLRRLQ